MLTLSKLQASFAKPQLNANSKKYLRISVGSVVKHTLNPAKIITDKSIQWNESIVLPLMFNKQFSFQIYDKHQFGYKQQQFQKILSGCFQLTQTDEKSQTWEIFTKNGDQIGYLSSSIDIPRQITKSPSSIKRRRFDESEFAMNESSAEKHNLSIIKEKNSNASYIQRNESSIRKSQINQEGKVFKVSSIVAKITGSRFKKGYVVIQVGDRKIQTKAVRSRSGELVFIESEEIDYHQSDTDATVKIYSIDSHNQPLLIAQGVLQLLVPKPPRNIGLMKDGFEAGQMLIDCRIQDRNKGKTNYSHIFNQNSSIFQQKLPKKSQYRPEASRSVNYARLQDFGISNTSRVHYYGLDSSRSTISPKKRVSVLQGNSNIAFPQQKRFMVYQDKQNERISYLHDRSFEFKNPISGKYYKGAGLGYGGKTDFTRQKNSVPGVGNYRLPSIWDRY